MSTARDAGRVRFTERSVLPGLRPALGYSLFYLGVIVLLPLAEQTSDVCTIAACCLALDAVEGRHVFRTAA